MADIAYLFELIIQDGKLADVRQQASDYAQAVQAAEPGTLEYQWWLSEDGTRCLLKETFDSSDSLLRHLDNVGPSLPQLLAITRNRIVGHHKYLAHAIGHIQQRSADWSPGIFGNPKQFTWRTIKAVRDPAQGLLHGII